MRVSEMSQGEPLNRELESRDVRVVKGVRQKRFTYAVLKDDYDPKQVWIYKNQEGAKPQGMRLPIELCGEIGEILIDYAEEFGVPAPE